MVVEVPKGLVESKSKLIGEGLKEVLAVDLAKSAALDTFPTEAERALDLYDEIRQFGVATGLRLWTSALVITKRMVAGRGE